jgi:hypothetical protein
MGGAGSINLTSYIAEDNGAGFNSLGATTVRPLSFTLPESSETGCWNLGFIAPKGLILLRVKGCHIPHMHLLYGRSKHVVVSIGRQTGV